MAALIPMSCWSTGCSSSPTPFLLWNQQRGGSGSGSTRRRIFWVGWLPETSPKLKREKPRCQTVLNHVKGLPLHTAPALLLPALIYVAHPAPKPLFEAFKMSQTKGEAGATESRAVKPEAGMSLLILAASRSVRDHGEPRCPRRGEHVHLFLQPRG